MLHTKHDDLLLDIITRLAFSRPIMPSLAHLGVYAHGVGGATVTPAVRALVYVHASVTSLVRPARAVRADALRRAHARVPRRTLAALVTRSQVSALNAGVARLVQVAL